MPHYIDYDPPQTPWLDLIHVTDTYIVTNKQSGLLSVPGREDSARDCLQSRLEADFGEIHVVHRLDLPTSGVIVYARNLETHRHLSAQWRARTVDKTYEAIVYGEMDADEGEIDLPLIADWPNRPMQKVCHETGKPALTRWRVLSREAGRTRLSIQPVTGRSHQIRVHLNARGYPILGDPLYGCSDSQMGADRLLLHAVSLAFDNPETGARKEYAAPTPF